MTSYLFDSKDEAPELVVNELGESKAMVECFRALLLRYLAGDLPALEVV